MPLRPVGPDAAFRVHRGGATETPVAGAVVAVGNFDGVHRGHQRLIAVAQEEARAQGRPAAVLTFEPHPRTFFAPEKPLFRLTHEPEKLSIFARLGLDAAFVRRFDETVAGLSARDFVGGLVAAEIGAAGVVAGHDFRFGRGREGTPESLAALCAERGLSCTIVPAVTGGDGPDPVSSSAIRAALEAGRVAGANRLLGYRWFVMGEVRHGAKRGRTLGYPTANLRLADDCRLAHGIYAVRAAVPGAGLRDAVASFGRRPTFDHGAPLLEVFVFDFWGDLYGQTLAVEFVDWVRGEERFASAEALVRQMDADSAKAREILRGDPLGRRSPASLIA